MKNWGKCLHESQTNIWDVCVHSKGKQSTSLSNSSAVEPPYSK